MMATQAKAAYVVFLQACLLLFASVNNCVAQENCSESSANPVSEESSGVRGQIFCAPGIPGVPGNNGVPGFNGVQGPVGPKGEPGQGLSGPKGDRGDRGQTGDQGEAGLAGVRGPPGKVGPPGLKGDVGDRGHKGDQGEYGPPGQRGQKGERGEPIFATPTPYRQPIVAFSVYPRDHFRPSSNTVETVILNGIITNMGGGYDSGSGVFTCSVPGLYFFSFSLMKLSTNQLMAVFLKLNDRIISMAHDNQGHRDQTTNSATLVLAIGDRVWLECSYDIHNGKYSTFTGILLHEINETD